MPVVDRVWQGAAGGVQVRRGTERDVWEAVRNRSRRAKESVLLPEEGLLSLGVSEPHGQGSLGWTERLSSVKARRRLQFGIALRIFSRYELFDQVGHGWTDSGAEVVRL
jgi:hypothetical protein